MSSNPETRWTLHLASCQRKKYKYGKRHFKGSRKLWFLLRLIVILDDLLRLDQVGFILDQVGFILDQTSLKRIRLDGSDLVELSFHHDRTWIDVNLPGVMLLMAVSRSVPHVGHSSGSGHLARLPEVVSGRHATHTAHAAHGRWSRHAPGHAHHGAAPSGQHRTHLQSFKPLTIFKSLNVTSRRRSRNEDNLLQDWSKNFGNFLPD